LPLSPLPLGSTSYSFEHLFLDTMLGWPGNSTMQFIGDAADNEIPILGIGPENAASVVPTLNIHPQMKDEIQRAVDNGKRVIVPQTQQKLADWDGTGFIEYDPVT